MTNGLNFVKDLATYIGQTVTIFTTSGGQLGNGFTGILACVNCRFVRLVTQIGPGPGCTLGNCCDPENLFSERNFTNRQRHPLYNTNQGLGSIVDIPIDRIASFVHTSVGSGGW